jgi:hypothetical protein
MIAGPSPRLTIRLNITERQVEDLPPLDQPG